MKIAGRQFAPLLLSAKTGSEGNNRARLRRGALSTGGLRIVTRQHALQMRLKIYTRREAYIWLSRKHSEKVRFGWILGVRPNDVVLFKDDDCPGVTDIPVNDIDSCGVI
jgi:hypothetical protein